MSSTLKAVKQPTPHGSNELAWRVLRGHQVVGLITSSKQTKSVLHPIKVFRVPARRNSVDPLPLLAFVHEPKPAIKFFGSEAAFREAVKETPPGVTPAQIIGEFEDALKLLE